MPNLRDDYNTGDTFSAGDDDQSAARLRKLGITRRAALGTGLRQVAIGSAVFTAGTAVVGAAVLHAADAATVRTAIGAQADLGNIVVTDPAYGAVGDAVAITDASMSNGSAVCMSASNPFTASMVGKTVLVAGAGGRGTPLISTVASYQNRGQITLSNTAIAASNNFGGPNVNAIVGTDNSSAFAAAFSAAAAKAAAANSETQRYQNVTAIFVPGGNYLTTTGVPALQVEGISFVGAGMNSTRIWHCGTDAFLQMGTFNASASSAWYGVAQGLWVKDLALTCPLAGARRGIGIQDNGSGGLSLDNVYLFNFTYGVYATSGSDVSRFGPNLYFAYCDVGMYLGPRSQQILIQGADFGNCGEGLVNEGAPQGVMIGCSFENNSIADITYDGVATGATRAGMDSAVLGGGYGGSWAHIGCWFETMSATVQNNQNIWIKSTGAANGWQGLQFRNCYLVSGGRAQVSGGTNAFISDGGTVAANPVVDGLSVRGSSINGLYYYYGSDTKSSAVLTNIFRQSGSSAVALFLGSKFVPTPVNTVELGGGADIQSTLGGGVEVQSNGSNGVDLVTTTGTATLSGKTLTSPKITSGNAPATATSTGTVGQIEWDSGYVYICTATNTWKRTAIDPW